MESKSIAESAGSSLRHVIGMTPDLDHIWELATAKYERRQITATKLKDNVGRSHRALSSIINNALEELRSCKDYAHVRSFREVETPTNFNAWLSDIEFVADIDDMKTAWKVESIYTAIAPLEFCLPSLSKAYTNLKSEARMRSRTRRSDLSRNENYQATLLDVQRQTASLARISNEMLKPFAKEIEEHWRALEKEKSGLEKSTLTAFEDADGEGKLEIIAPLWAEATNHKSTSVWEQTWHQNKMNTIRTLMRLHLINSIERLYSDVTKMVEQLDETLS